MGTTDVLAGAIALIERGYGIGPNAINSRGVAVRAIDPEAGGLEPVRRAHRRG